MHTDEDTFAEARRMLTICNVCDYCSGFCEMFRAAGRRNILTDPDLAYLAHLCHDCGNCLDACQYAPPHVFDIDPPKVLAEVRSTFWPATRSWFALAFVPLAPLLTMLFVPAEILFSRHRGEGAFYAVLPWSILCLGAGLTLLWSLVALCLGVFRFWRNTGGGDPRGAFAAAFLDIVSMRNLEGGGIDCDHSGLRRWGHQVLVTGFGLCLASTSVATLYHHSFGYQAPYPYLSLPVVLGNIGGLLMLAGCGCLWWSKIQRNRKRQISAIDDYGLLALLVMVTATGFALMIWRETILMGMLLAVHFGTVLSLFLFISSGKLAHGAYRAAALLRAAMERREG